MTRYKEIHHHGVNAVFNPSHKHSNMVFPEKNVSYFGEGIMEKKTNQTLEQTASLPRKQLVSLGTQATVQSTQAGFQIVFKPCRELFYIHEDRAYKFKACMYCYNKKNVAIPNK